MARTIRYAAPGRINLIGEHTDYNLGFALPIALPERTVVTYLPDDTHGARRAQRLGRTAKFGSRSTPLPAMCRLGRLRGGRDVGAARSRSPDTRRDDVDRERRRDGLGCGVVGGAGMRSSRRAHNRHRSSDRPRRAGPHRATGRERLCRSTNGTDGSTGRAVRRVTQGVVDRLSARRACGRWRSIRTPRVSRCCSSIPARHTNMPAAGMRRGGRHANAPPPISGVGSLREVQDRGVAVLDGVSRSGRCATRPPHPDRQPRVLEVVAALEDSDFAAMGQILTASQASMRDDFEITTDHIDLIADTAVRAGALGARMTGGGFGGCVIALVPFGQVDVHQRRSAARRSRCRLQRADDHPHACRAGGGPVDLTTQRTCNHCENLAGISQ